MKMYSQMLMKITNLGMPNVYNNLIKKAVEGFWKGEKKEEDIQTALLEVQKYNSSLQENLDLRPKGDIDIYDRLLRTSILFGFTPDRFGPLENKENNLETYLSIPRGTSNAHASSMVKWFNTNYHVVQPEIERSPRLNWFYSTIVSDDIDKLAIIGPWTFLSYAINKTNKSKEELFQKLTDEYLSFLNNHPSLTIQLEEPSFLTQGIPAGYDKFVEKIEKETHLHVYFGAVNHFAQKLFSLPVEGIGLDFVDGESNIELLTHFPKNKKLIAGIINGKNVRPVSLKTKNTLDQICQEIPEEKLYISPSCSLQHVPLTTRDENEYVQKNLVFAIEKIQELEKIREGSISYKQIDEKKKNLTTTTYQRSRVPRHLNEVAFPTTTIGSFPQTKEIRSLRHNWKNKNISDEKYEQEIKLYIKNCIKKQKDLGLDILVHGEPERNDMVQYFAENLQGFTIIKSPVQSYGTRLVRPPVIIADIKRTAPITVKWSKYANSLTNNEVKGMLTGPVTMVQWSFPREDISKEEQFYQVAKVLSNEVDDLVNAGIKHVQIDEPALREALPFDPEKKEFYLKHAINAFRQVYANVPEEIIIHSHMCFSEFPDIIESIKEMEVDVLSIEDSKAQGKTAVALIEGGFPGTIGLGVYDVHSPRIPSIEEMIKIPEFLLKNGIDPLKIWINPDCGLKTRGEEAYKQLENLVNTAKKLKKTYYCV
jgi:5-methyltetrahydropteroyltriglutamate--homocysteine methyltransferase